MFLQPEPVLSRCLLSDSSEFPDHVQPLQLNSLSLFAKDIFVISETTALTWFGSMILWLITAGGSSECLCTDWKWHWSICTTAIGSPVTCWFVMDPNNVKAVVSEMTNMSFPKNIAAALTTVSHANSPGVLIISKCSNQIWLRVLLSCTGFACSLVSSKFSHAITTASL